MHNQLKKQRNNSAYVPAVSYQVAKESHFIHSGHVYPVATCDSAVFRSAVLALAPRWSTNEAYNGFLAAAKIGMAERWFLIVGLAEAGKSMRLYGSLDEAEKAVQVGV